MGWEDPLEKGKAMQYSGEFRGLYSLWGCKESDMTERLTFPRYLGHVGKGKPGKGMQYVPSCCPKTISNKIN